MAEIAKLVPRIKFNVRRRHRNMKHMIGPIGRIDSIRAVLNGLFKYERLECTLSRCDESRGYAERLICEAIRHGDKHPPTMEMADFWLNDKQLIHKLFKVLAPRYKDYKTSVTTMYNIPMRYHMAVKPYHFQELCVLELKGNPYPPIPEKPKPNKSSLTNILLKEASKEFRKMKLDSNTANKET